MYEAGNVNVCLRFAKQPSKYHNSVSSNESMLDTSTYDLYFEKYPIIEPDTLIYLKGFLCIILHTHLW